MSTDSSGANTTTYAYDAAGNMTQAPLPISGTQQYNYDGLSHLVSLGNPSSPSSWYTFDAEGARVRKDTPSGWTEYVNFNGQTIAENSSSGWTDYVFANGQRIARLDPTDMVYYSADHLGTTTVVTSGTGALLNDSDFYPYGAEYAVTTSDPNHYKFTGQERDAESGNDYFNARYFTANIGRFMSPDPSGLAFADPTNPQSLNLYTYALNNPLKYVDPSGLDYCEADGQTLNDVNDEEDCLSLNDTWYDLSFSCAPGMPNVVCVNVDNDPDPDPDPPPVLTTDYTLTLYQTSYGGWGGGMAIFWRRIIFKRDRRRWWWRRPK